MSLTSRLSQQDQRVYQCCKYLGIPRSTYYRWKKPKTMNVKRQKQRHPRALTEQEEQTVLTLLHSERFIDQAPGEIYAILLDEGDYYCSPRTMYRLLARHQETRLRRQKARIHHYQKPQLLAQNPNEVWSWDITKLKGPKKWVYYYLYVILDIYSRYVVGWLLADCESSYLAKHFIQKTLEKQNITMNQLTLHADRGASMKSKAVALLLADLGVTKSHSRPYTSDDNPFSESQFKTLKYCPQFPAQFGCIEDAKQFCQHFFRWYNEEHRHSGINRLTPYSLHHGLAQQAIAQRNRILKQAYECHPERFTKHIPHAGDIPQAVWINPPSKATHNPQENTIGV